MEWRDPLKDTRTQAVNLATAAKRSARLSSMTTRSSWMVFSDSSYWAWK